MMKICQLKIILQKVQNVERSPSTLRIRYAHLANARTRSSKFSDIRRQIHEQFWKLPKDEQNHHLFKSILTKSVSRHRPWKEEAKNRSAFRKYHMKDEYGK